MSLLKTAGIQHPSLGTQSITIDGTTGAVSFPNGPSLGDITAVTAGTGISGGGSSGDVTITNSMATAIDAKGDLIAGTGADTFSALTVGANDTVLTADSSTATGLKWATPSSGGGMTLISETVASALSSLSLSSIPGTYKQLMLVWSGIYHSATGSTFGIRFNNSTNTYWGNGLGAVATSTVGAFGYNETSITKSFGGVDISPFGTSANFSTTDNNAQANGYLLIDNYASTTKYKHFETSFGFYNNSSLQYCSLRLNAANSDTAAITSIDVVRLGGSATFTNRTNTSIRLYGLS